MIQPGKFANQNHKVPDIELVIFDWDGTLMDSTAKICNAMQATAKVMNLPVPTRAAVEQLIGLSLSGAFENLFGNLKFQEQEALTEAYRHQYLVVDSTPTPLFQEARAALEYLKESGYTLGVATGKNRKGLDRVLAETELGHFFAATRCADEAQSKPHPEMVLSLADELKVEPSRALVVGDTSFDMEMAHRGGMQRIGVSFGAHAVEQLHPFEPITVLDCLSELRRYL